MTFVDAAGREGSAVERLTAAQLHLGANLIPNRGARQLVR